MKIRRAVGGQGAQISVAPIVLCIVFVATNLPIKAAPYLQIKYTLHEIIINKYGSIGCVQSTYHNSSFGSMQSKYVYELGGIMSLSKKKAYEKEAAEYRINDSGALTVYCKNKNSAKNVSIEPSMLVDGIRYPVTEIGNKSFSDCTSLISITIPSSVTKIGEYAFYNCTSLTSVTVPGSVTEIGNGTFYGCTSLTSVTIPDSVTKIGENAFADCTSLETINIPSSVRQIEANAFSDRTRLVYL